ncbi:MAG: hypothetical protein PHY88_05270 [Candidatus Omnitrophica bacterium]|nr:hypothetical protein [Candidatus Omnitrophota bacterium]
MGLTSAKQGDIFYTGDFLVKKGQSVIEYVVIFAILVGLSVILLKNIPKIFQDYVSNATEKME